MKILTIDLEYDFESDKLESLSIVPKLLDFFDDNNIKATFFCLGEIVKDNEDLIKEINKKHEIASHSFSHRRLNKLDYIALDNEIKKSKEVFKDLKINVRGFRAPYFITNKYLWKILKENGFSYSSSLAGYFPGRYFNINLKPRKINDVLELPIPNVIFPFPNGLSYHRLLYPFSRDKGGYMFYFHPCEFLRKVKSNNINFFVKQIYKRNLKKSKIIFENILNNEKWVSCKEFISSSPLKQYL